MKICQEEGCNTEIEAWQTYCQKHYAMRMQGQPQPQSQVPEAPAEPQVVEEQVVEEKVAEEKKTLPDAPVERPPLPQIDERTASIVSQVAFKGAIELMSNMAFEEKTFEELVGETRTLTNEFYRIIVEKRV